MYAGIGPCAVAVLVMVLLRPYPQWGTRQHDARLGHQRSAVHVDHLAGDLARGLRQQEDRDVRAISTGCGIVPSGACSFARA